MRWLLAFLVIQAGSSLPGVGVGAASGGPLEIVAGAPLTGTNDSPTGRNPRLMWAAQRQGVWNRWRADYQANTSNPATRGGKWYKQIKALAETTPANPNVDLGHLAAWMYQVTGDAAYVELAWGCFEAWLFLLPGPPGWDDPFGWDSNYVRNWFSKLTVAMEYLWPGLTAERREQLWEAVVGNTEHHVEVYVAAGEGGWPLGDSDQLVGVWVQVAMQYHLWPNSPRTQAMWNLAKTGGLAATASDHVSTARNAIKHYVTDLAAGGEWCESSAYNLHTTVFLMDLWLSMRNFHGTDHFPEIAAWLPDFAGSLLSSITPDGRFNHKWGDDETPQTFLAYAWWEVLTYACGLLKDVSAGEQLQQMIVDLGAEHGLTGGSGTFSPNLGEHGGVYAYDDETAAEAYATGANKPFYSSGIALQRLKSGYGDADTEYAVLGARRVPDATQGTWWPDHFVHYVSDPWMYKNGEAVLTHPQTYNGASNQGEGSNTCLIHGLQDCWEFKDALAHNEATTHAYLCMTTGGSLLPKDYTQPPVVVHEYTRSTLYVPGATDVLIVHDRLHVADIAGGDLATYPPATPDVQNGGSFGDFIARKRARKQIVWHMPVSPTVSGDAVTWATGAGQKCKLTVVTPTGLTAEVFDETVDFRAGVDAGWPTSPPYRYGWHPTNVLETETKFQVQRYSNNTWDSVLQVFLVHGTTTPATPTLKQSTGVDGVHVVRTGESDVVAFFNGAQSGTLNATAYHTSHDAALRAAHYFGAGTYSPPSWTASASTTELYLLDLNPSLSWTLNVDGGGANGITPDSGGFYRTTVSGTGSHSVTVVGS